MIDVAGRAIDLEALAVELTAGGVAIRALGISYGYLHTYDAAGGLADLPAEAGPIVAAHVPPVRQPTPALTERLAIILAAAPELSQATKDALVAALREGTP